jgi:hypothetical protein
LYRPWLDHYEKISISKHHQSQNAARIVSRPYTHELINGIPHADSAKEDYSKWHREQKSLKERIEEGISHLCKEATKNNGGRDKNQQDKTIFVKHMAKHYFLYDFENEIEQETRHSDSITVSVQHKHVLLVRDPVAILSSWNVAKDVHHNAITPDELGIIQLLSIYSTLKSLNKAIVVLDSDPLTTNAIQTLHHLCHDLDIPFLQSMLTWPNGKHDCDGPWADYWYQNVHRCE